MTFLKRDPTGRVWVRLPVEAQPFEKRHTPYAPAQDEVRVHVVQQGNPQWAASGGQVLVSANPYGLTLKPGINSKRGYRMKMVKRRVKDTVMESYEVASPLVEVSAPPAANNLKTLKAQRLAAMSKTFGIAKNKDVFPQDALVFEREIREEW